MEKKELPVYPNQKETEKKNIEKQKYLDKYYNNEFIKSLFA